MSTEALDAAVIAVRQSAGRLQRAIRARQRVEDLIKGARCEEQIARNEHSEAQARLIQLAGGVNEWGLVPASEHVVGRVETDARGAAPAKESPAYASTHS